jgi:U4/U6.U5 tri-snRNP-associated protein 1
MADAASIEAMNVIRASMGMAPLPPPAGPLFKTSAVSSEDAPSTLESREAEGYDNYRKKMEAEKAQAERAARLERIKRERDREKRLSRLPGKGLGEADAGEDGSARVWLMKQKKRQKEVEKARKFAEEKAAAEAAAAATEYTSKDLAGVKVGHELDTFGEGEDQILILKDQTIDAAEEEGDELENMQLREAERLREKLELKRKPLYNPHDVDENGETKLLAHYDVEIEGKKGSKFTLDGQGSTAEQREQRLNDARQPRAKTFSLDILSKSRVCGS